MNRENIIISNIMGSEISMTSTLTFFATDIMFNGVYICFAINSVGVSGSPSTTLTVNGEDQYKICTLYQRQLIQPIRCFHTAAPVITTPPVSFTVVAPEEAVFTCSAEGFPGPSISWRRINNDGSATIVEQGGIITISESSTDFTITSTLTLSPTDLTLSGLYVCIATNNLGAINISASLAVNGNHKGLSVYNT